MLDKAHLPVKQDSIIYGTHNGRPAFLLLLHNDYPKNNNNLLRFPEGKARLGIPNRRTTTPPSRAPTRVLPHTCHFDQKLKDDIKSKWAAIQKDISLAPKFNITSSPPSSKWGKLTDRGKHSGPLLLP